MAELNVRKRGTKWEYRFECAKVDGKRKQISKGGFLTKKEAAAAGTKALAEYNNSGVHFEPSEISVADYLDYWFDNYCKMNLKYNTQSSYGNIIKNIIKPVLGKYRLKNVTPLLIQGFANSLKSSGLSKSTLEVVLAILSSSVNYAIEPMRYIDYNPCSRVKIPKFEVAKKEKDIISQDEFKRIIERFPEGSHYHIPLLLGFYTGMRIGEALALTWDDVDFKNKTISINKTLVRRNFKANNKKSLSRKEIGKNIWYFGTTKTKGSNRTIKIGDVLVNALKKEKGRQAENELRYGEFYTECYAKKELDEKGEEVIKIISSQKSKPIDLQKLSFVSTKENGEMVTLNSMQSCVKTVQNQLGILFSFHSLRHTHATMLIEAGVSPKSVQERLGHSDIVITLQIYTKNTEQMENALVDTFEKLAK